jgi:hypothetical protein
MRKNVKMPTVTTLHDLVTTVSSAITLAQNTVERHYMSLIRQYFDSEGRPYSLDIKLPNLSSQNSTDAVRQLTVPILALVESRALGISSCEISLDVTLTGLDALTPPPEAPQTAGAPLDVPNLDMQLMRNAQSVSVEQAATATTSTAALGAEQRAALNAFAAHGATPAFAMGIRVDSAPASAGPVAKLAIRVEERPASEALSRLVTHLNTLL